MSLLGIRRLREVGKYGGRATEVGVVWQPKILPTGGARGVIHCHGYGAGADIYLDQTYGNIPGVLAQRGFVNYAADCGSSANSYGTFGNDDTIDAIGDQIAYLRASLGVVGKVHLLGGSMGAMGALNYAVRNPDEVASVTSIIGIVDANDFHDNNRGGYATTLEAAYGGLAGWNAAKATHDPLTFADDLPSQEDMPKQLWYSTNDTICVPSTQTAFAEATGATLTSIGAQGHFAAGLIDPNDIADFMWAAS